MSDLVSLSAAKTHELIMSGQASAREVTEAHLARIKVRNPEINAITEILAEESLKTADLIDAGKTEHMPLAGVPVSTKGNVDQMGVATPNGIPALKDLIAREDAPVVGRLRQAGAILIGRTNTPEFSMRWCSSNPIYGATLNPWNSELTPGGSSGGAAAALAEGMGALAHGNDLGGSLRFPSYCCGVASIRPSNGLIAAFNPSAPSERPAVQQFMSVQGPMARHVDDLRLGLRIMSGRDWRDPASIGSLATPRLSDLERPLRIALSTDPFGDGLDTVPTEALSRARQSLVDAGCEIVERDLPAYAEADQVWGKLFFSELETAMGGLIRKFGSPDVVSVHEGYCAHYGLAELPEFLSLLARRIGIQREWNAMLEEFDAVVAPVSGDTPFENDLDFKDPERLTEILAQQRHLFPVNLTGFPSAAVSTGTANGMPNGVQVIGRMHTDELLLDIAELIEHAQGPLATDRLKTIL